LRYTEEGDKGDSGMAVSLRKQIAVGEGTPVVPINLEQYHQMIRDPCF
jgi:hypothetical protein